MFREGNLPFLWLKPTMTEGFRRLSYSHNDLAFLNADASLTRSQCVSTGSLKLLLIHFNGKSYRPSLGSPRMA